MVQILRATAALRRAATAAVRTHSAATSQQLPACKFALQRALAAFTSSTRTQQLRRPFSTADNVKPAEEVSSPASEQTTAEAAVIGDETTTTEAKPATSPQPQPTHKSETKTMSFQAETRQLLDIVAHSLYTDKEVFIRELVSNASDALEKARYLQSTQQEALIDPDLPFEIRIDIDEANNVLTISDTGIGMTSEELVSHLGTIARSGSKAFVQQVKDTASATSSSQNASNIIGKFGVGFYSTFMVGNKIEVYSRSADKSKDQQAHYWASDGSGSYELAEADNVHRGTRIVIHLKPEAKEFSQRGHIESIAKKYSNFIGYPILVNGEKLQSTGAIWAKSPREVTDEQYNDFYRVSLGSYDTPTYRLHFAADVPLQIASLFYFPSSHMEKFSMARMDPGVSLYSRKVLIQAKSKDILPSWLRFVKGVVDSEDLPLNISRESMQDTALLKKLNNVLTKRIIKYLDEQSRSNPEKYGTWYNEFSAFLKEGVCTDYQHQREIAKLLRYETSIDGDEVEAAKSPDANKPKQLLHSFDDYISRMPPDQKSIYFINASNRTYAMASPYLEQLRQKKLEVIFAYAPVDDFVMKNLGEYNNRRILSVDSSEVAEELEAMLTDAERKQKAEKLQQAQEQHAPLVKFIQQVLGGKVKSVTVNSTRSSAAPAIIVDNESAAMRKMMQFSDPTLANQAIKDQKLEIHSSHPIIQGIEQVREQKPELARAVVEQVFDNACIAADLLDNPRSMLNRLNNIMTQALDSHRSSISSAAASVDSASDVSEQKQQAATAP